MLDHLVSQIDLGHVYLVARQYLRQALRSGGGIVFLFLVLVVGMLIASIPIAVLEQALEARKKEIRNIRRTFKVDENPMGEVSPQQQQALDEVRRKFDEEEANEGKFVQELVKQFRDWGGFWRFVGVGEDLRDEWLLNRPAVVSLVLLLVMFNLPVVVPIGTFNQMSADIPYKGIRYLLTRTSRVNLYLGRFLGALLFTVVTLAILCGVILLYMVLKVTIYERPAMIAWTARGWLAMVLFSLPFVSLCAMASAWTGRPAVTLIVVKTAVLLVPLVALIARQFLEWAGFVGYLMPWPLMTALLHPSDSYAVGASLAMLGYSLVFLLLGAVALQRRNL